MNFSEIRGQHHVLRAIEVALAGNHSLVIIGEPGSGKTSLINTISKMTLSLLYDNEPCKQFYLDSDLPVIMTTRPCACGWYLSEERECTCSAEKIVEHMSPFGNIRYHIDMWVQLGPLRFEQILDERPGESNEVLIARIKEAGELINEVAKDPDPAAIALLKKAHMQLRMSTGMVFRTISVARTITAMAGETKVGPVHIAEAIQYRNRFEL